MDGSPRLLDIAGRVEPGQPDPEAPPHRLVPTLTRELARRRHRQEGFVESAFDARDDISVGVWHRPQPLELVPEVCIGRKCRRTPTRSVCTHRTLEVDACLA